MPGAVCTRATGRVGGGTAGDVAPHVPQKLGEEPATTLLDAEHWSLSLQVQEVKTPVAANDEDAEKSVLVEVSVL